MGEDKEHCTRKQLCLEMMPPELQTNKTFLCMCTDHQAVMYIDKQLMHWTDDDRKDCSIWKQCLFSQRSAYASMMLDLVKLADTRSTRESHSQTRTQSHSTTSELSASSSLITVGTNVTNSQCFQPDAADSLEKLTQCNCLPALITTCGDPFQVDRQKCLREYACCHPKVCSSWTAANCEASVDIDCMKFSSPRDEDESVSEAKRMLLEHDLMAEQRQANESQELNVGARVKAKFENQWRIGTIVAKPKDGAGRYTVQDGNSGAFFESEDVEAMRKSLLRRAQKDKRVDADAGMLKKTSSLSQLHQQERLQLDNGIVGKACH